MGFTAAVGAVHYGASFIEKHICLNNKIGLDSQFSLRVDELKNFKNEISNAFLSKGKIFMDQQKTKLKICNLEDQYLLVRI